MKVCKNHKIQLTFSFSIKNNSYLSFFRNIFPVKPLACILGFFMLIRRSLLLLDPMEESLEIVEGDITELVEQLSFLTLMGDKVVASFLGELPFPF